VASAGEAKKRGSNEERFEVDPEILEEGEFLKAQLAGAALVLTGFVLGLYVSAWARRRARARRIAIAR
jgi:hypothetical protein